MYTISGAAVARKMGRVSCKRGGPLALGVCGRAVPCEQGCVRPGVYGGGGAARTGEHGEERGEEAPPGHVEGARVRVAVVEDDELDRLVLGVHLHVDRQRVSARSWVWSARADDPSQLGSHRHGEDAAENVLLTTAVHALLLEGSVQLVNVVLERLDGRLELLQLLSGSHGRLRARAWVGEVGWVRGA